MTLIIRIHFFVFDSPVNDANFSRTDCPPNLPPLLLNKQRKKENEEESLLHVAPLSCFMTLAV